MREKTVAPILQAVLTALLSFAVLTGAPRARAEGPGGWDESAYFATRLLPRGLAFSGTLGYGQPVWGKGGPGQVLFGYVRPSATLISSVLLNRAELGVDLFPVSFFGVRAGAIGTQRAVDLDTLDCVALNCRGLLGTVFLKPQLLLGYGPVSAMAAAHVSWLASSNAAQAFGDDVSNLAGLAGGDERVGTEVAAQLRLGESFAAGTYLTADHMLGSGSTNDMLSVFGKYLRGSFSYMAGVGAYESTTQTRAFTCYALIGWTGIPAIGLH